MLKAEMARGYCTPAHELMFAFGLMDLSNAEAGLAFTSLPFMYGAPNPKLKSALVQVQHGAWMASQRDKSTAYKALKRLVQRQVFKVSKKGRYILNTRYGEWLDRNLAPVFAEGSQALQSLQKLMEIRPYWRGTDAGQDIPEADQEEGGTHPQEDTTEGAHTPIEKGAHTPEKWADTPTPGGHTPPQKGAGTPNNGPQSRPGSDGAPQTDSILLLEGVSKQSRSLPPDLRAFCSDVCSLTPAQVEQVESFAGEFELGHLTSAIERLANTKKPANPVGFIRALAGDIAQGGSVSLPSGARTLARFRPQWQLKQRLTNALQPQKQSTNGASPEPKQQLDTIRKAAREAEARGVQGAGEIADAAAREAEKQTQKARQDKRTLELAEAFTQRPHNNQLGVIEFARSNKWLRPFIPEAERWIANGRPEVARCDMAVRFALASLEEDGRKVFDQQEIEGAELETIEATGAPVSRLQMRPNKPLR